MDDLDHVPASKRKELEIRWKTSNAEKSKKMTDIVLRDWSLLYSHILESVKDVHIILYQKMKDECPLEKDGHPGSFDGPLAFRFLMADIQRYVSGDVKRQDKHIYEDAFQMQTTRKLPDHCLTTDYTKPAHTFITTILPNMARPPTGNDPGDHLIDMLPANLKILGKGLRKEMIAEGTFTDLMKVASECAELVGDEAKGVKAPPALLSSLGAKVLERIAGYETIVTEDLSRIAGMAIHTTRHYGDSTSGIDYTFEDGALVAGTIPGAAMLQEATMAGVGGKDFANRTWCKGCPHPKGG